jgi:23S rRNA (pseudouridine1915-N3)-methyltransferase
MKIQILQIAPTKDKNIAALEAEYEKRLQPYAQIETISMPASKSDTRNRVQSDEKGLFLQKLNEDSFVIALDERGQQLTSEEFAALLGQQRDFGPGKVQFLIGGSHGLHTDVLAKAHKKLSLSKMTFTHEMVRVFLMEQLYRAATILVGKKYHK